MQDRFSAASRSFRGLRDRKGRRAREVARRAGSRDAVSVLGEIWRTRNVGVARRRQRLRQRFKQFSGGAARWFSVLPIGHSALVHAHRLPERSLAETKSFAKGFDIDRMFHGVTMEKSYRLVNEFLIAGYGKVTPWN